MGRMENPGARAGATPEQAFKSVQPDGWIKDRWRWLRGVRRDPALSPMARLIAQSLGLGFANRVTGECRPGVTTIATDCATSSRTVARCLSELGDRGWIERRGGNAPGIRAEIAFQFPERHTTDLVADNAPGLAGTYASSGNPPTPPNKDKPKINHTAHPHPKVAILGLPQPQCEMRVIAPGSTAAKLWDAWLEAEGFPPLDQIGRQVDGGYRIKDIHTWIEDCAEKGTR